MPTMAKNKYLLFLYEKAMPSTLTWIEKFEAAQAAGFDGIEISVDETDEKLSRLSQSTVEWDSIVQAAKKTGISVSSICLSAHRLYPLGSLDPETQEKSLEIMEKALIFADYLGAKIIQLAGYDVYYTQGSEETRQIFIKNLKKAVVLASRYGIVLGFETMETDFMNTCQKAMTFIEDVKSPYLGLYPDIGNLTNGNRFGPLNIEDDLNLAYGHIFAAHLKEVVESKYREIPFGTGDTRYHQALIELKVQGVYRFTAEFWYKGSALWRDDLKFANFFVRSKIDKVFD